jgi:hypothetical protein
MSEQLSLFDNEVEISITIDEAAEHAKVSSATIRNWINGLANKKGAELTALANSSNGTKLLGISTATVGVVGFCYAFTPRVATLIVSKSISAWNKIIICITSVLPTGVTLVINGVKLKTI